MTRPPPADPHLRLLDDARQAQAVADRSQRRLLEEAHEHDATFRGSLRDVAEAGAPVVMETVVGRRLGGAIRALAADHVVLDGPHGTAWVRLAAVTVLHVRDTGGARAGGGDRPDRPGVSFAAALRTTAEVRADVEVVFTGGSTLRGSAVAIGRDVLTVRDRVTGSSCLVHLARAALVLAPRG